MSYDPQEPHPVGYVPGAYTPSPAYVPPSVYGQPPTSPAPIAPQRKSRTVPILLAALVVLTAAVAVLLYVVIAKPGTTQARSVNSTAAIFTQARTDCRIVAGYDIEDAGRTLNITVAGAFMSSGDLTCLAGELRMPDAIMQHVMSTRALDGQQTDSWPGYTARWTYHPDDGLQMTIREA